MSPLEESFIELYDAHYDEVHAFCVRRVGWDRADDAVSEVFAVVWRRIGDVRPDTGRAWLFSIARGVVLNQWRSARRRQRLVQRVGAFRTGPPDGPETVVVRRSEDEAVVRTLDSLSSGDAEILRLAAWEELTGPEIAEALAISLPAAQKRLNRARKRFAKVLEQRHLGTPDIAAEGADS